MLICSVAELIGEHTNKKELIPNSIACREKHRQEKAYTYLMEVIDNAG
jgi:hypothetical protein